MNKLFLDDWAGNIISNYSLIKAGGVAGFMNRLGEGDAYNEMGEKDGKGDWLYKAHTEGAKEHGFLNETYWVIKPSLPWQSQLEWVIRNWLFEYDDLPFCVDVELTGGKTGPQIVDCVGNFLGAFEGVFKYKPVIYTGKYWFWQTYMKDATGKLPLWQSEYDFWLAQYPLKSDPRVTCTWEQLKQYYATGWTKAIDPRDAKHPMRPAALWQWSGDKFILPGIQGPIDLNWVPEEWIEKNKKNQTPKPEPTCEDYRAFYDAHPELH
jgi:GH25 family lysozyme M1 (1,4-beta-N-acetylmuramidase)